MAPLLALVLITALPVPADAVAEPSPRPARDCPRVFGGEAAHEVARERRKRTLIWVDSTDEAVIVVHQADWTDARRLRIQGFELVRTLPTGRRGGRAALVRLAPDATPSGCEPGLYILRRDDFVGTQRRVIAVLDGAVLLGDADELLFLAARDTGNPELRLVWRSPWRVAKPTEPIAVGVTKRSKRKKRKRRRGKRR